MKVDELTGKHLEVAQWALDGYPTRGIAQTMDIPEIRAARLLSEVCAELGVKNRKELRAKYDQEEWEDALGHITRFIERNGHSGVPADY